MAVKKMTEMVLFSLAVSLFKNMSNIASLFSFIGNNTDEKHKITAAIMRLRIVVVGIRLGWRGRGE
jgi:hypothetical protein